MTPPGHDPADAALRRAAHAEVVHAIEPLVALQLPILKGADTAWQPTDYLPDFTTDAWRVEVPDLQRRAAGLSEDLLAVLVGDMVTEEALPSYSMALNTLVGDRDGTSPAPWARWLRGWTAEENRHGDLLNAYLRLSGRVDMHAVEETVHTLLANGFSARSDDDPYNLLVYTSVQERATRVSHGNVGRLAGDAGDQTLARICRVIAGDEARHETFYMRMMNEVLAIDPSGGVLAVHGMLHGRITMPGRFMGDHRDPDLFDRFALVAQRLGVYTALDYASIVRHVVEAWDIAGRNVSGDAAKAQEELCRAPARYARLADRVMRQVASQPQVPFRWIRR